MKSQISVLVLVGCAYIPSILAMPLLPVKVASKQHNENGNILEEIVAIYSDGKSQKITQNQHLNRCPVISRRNDFVAYLSITDPRFPNTKGFPVSELWVQSLTCDQKFHISRNYDASSQASWSPVNEEIVFIGMTLGSNSDLVIYDVNDHTSKIVARDAIASPSWSPDGKHIAYYNTQNKVSIVDLKSEAISSRTVSTDVGNRWGLYWGKSGLLYYAEENLGWIEYDLISEEKKNVGEDFDFEKCVDQSIFNWVYLLVYPNEK